MTYFIEGVLFKVDVFSFSHLLNFSSVSAGARPPWNRLNHAREGGGGLPQWQLQGALQHHGGQVHIREEIGFLNFVLCWLFLHFVGWLRRMFGNDYVTRIAINVLRSFDACYHAELQDMWYKAHYKEQIANSGIVLAASLPLRFESKNCIDIRYWLEILRAWALYQIVNVLNLPVQSCIECPVKSVRMISRNVGWAHVWKMMANSLKLWSWKNLSASAEC